MTDPVGDFKEWYFKMPVFTRTYLTASLGLTCLLRFNQVSILDLYYTFDQTFYTFELWRPFTSLCFMGKFDFFFIWSLIFAYYGIGNL